MPEILCIYNSSLSTFLFLWYFIQIQSQYPFLEYYVRVASVEYKHRLIDIQTCGRLVVIRLLMHLPTSADASVDGRGGLTGISNQLPFHNIF